jgi:transcriptional regulator with PAS, ATPase and Fis domain
MAKGGTLFLDEIGEVSPALQVRLLRVLQERTYEPLGGTRTEAADVRIIVATNQDLVDRMQKGHFREDLYYRVNVVRIELPPLRRRKEDIPPLVEHFIRRFNRLQDKSIQGIAAEALSLLMAHSWPGNVRELENIIERSFILCQSGLIDIGHLPEELTHAGANLQGGSRIHCAHDLIDAQAIRNAMAHSNNNRSAAARELGMHKTTLFRKMKRLGLSFPSRRGPTTREQ